MPASQGWEWDALGPHMPRGEPGRQGQRRDLSQIRQFWAKGMEVVLPVRPKRLPAQVLLLCLIVTAAGAACCSSPKLAHSIAKQALLAAGRFLPCLFASSVYIHLSLPRQFRALPKLS